jgi:hypothetical protein
MTSRLVKRVAMADDADVLGEAVRQGNVVVDSGEGKE